jgi:hypothetical protein
VSNLMLYPVVHVLPEMQTYYPSTIVKQLKCMGLREWLQR